jgi:hypothetical protein
VPSSDGLAERIGCDGAEGFLRHVDQGVEGALKSRRLLLEKFLQCFTLLGGSRRFAGAWIDPLSPGIQNAIEVVEERERVVGCSR